MIQEEQTRKRTTAVTVLYGIATAVVIFLALWFAAIKRQEQLSASIPVEQRTATLASSTVTGQGQTATDPRIRARINPAADEIFLRAIDLNIDADEDLEQIIVARRVGAGRDSGKVYLILADLQPVTAVFARVQELALDITRPEGLFIDAFDIDSDSKPELIVQGLADQDRQSCAIFRNSERQRLELAFAVQGLSVTFLAPDTSEPARIIVDTQVNGVKDIPGMRTEYRWVAARHTFMLAGTTRLSIDLSEIRAAIGTTREEYLTWLAGELWTMDAAGSSRNVFMDPARNEIILSDGLNMQRWVMVSKYRSGTRLNTACVLSGSGALERMISIDFVNRDSMRLSVSDEQISRFHRDEGWSGLYHRKEAVAASQPLSQAPTVSPKPPLPSLDGRYRSSDGLVLEIQGTRARFAGKGVYLTGMVALYMAGTDMVFDFLQTDEKGLTTERRMYRLSIEMRENGEIVTIMLDPSRYDSNGFQPGYRTPLIFRKTS